MLYAGVQYLYFYLIKYLKTDIYKYQLRIKNYELHLSVSLLYSQKKDFSVMKSLFLYLIVQQSKILKI